MTFPFEPSNSRCQPRPNLVQIIIQNFEFNKPYLIVLQFNLATCHVQAVSGLDEGREVMTQEWSYRLIASDVVVLSSAFMQELLQGVLEEKRLLLDASLFLWQPMMGDWDEGSISRAWSGILCAGGLQRRRSCAGRISSILPTS